MLSWKRSRSQVNHDDEETMEKNKMPNNSNLGSNIRSFLGMSSRVFSGQFFVDACNTLKTVAPPSNPLNLVTPRLIPNPSKILKRWAPSEVGLGVATSSMTNDLVSRPESEHETVPPVTATKVVHRSLIQSNDDISSHYSSSSRQHFEGTNDHKMTNIANKSFFRLPIDPCHSSFDGYFPSDDDNEGDDDEGYFQEVNANGMFSVVITPPKAENYFPTSEFMRYCHACRKILAGKDIYIYRGDKAYCSEECREEGISLNEGKLKKRKVSRRGKPKKKLGEPIMWI